MWTMSEAGFYSVSRLQSNLLLVSLALVKIVVVSCLRLRFIKKIIFSLVWIRGTYELYALVLFILFYRPTFDLERAKFIIWRFWTSRSQIDTNVLCFQPSFILVFLENFILFVWCYRAYRNHNIYLFIYLFTQYQTTSIKSLCFPAFQTNVTCYLNLLYEQVPHRLRPHFNPIVINKIKIVMSATTV